MCHIFCLIFHETCLGKESFIYHDQLLYLLMSYSPVKDVMHRVTLVDGNKSVTETAKLMTTVATTVTREVGSVLVAKNNEPVGILTERDILKKVVAAGLDPTVTKISQVMSAPLITVPVDTNIGEASRIMIEKGIRRLPITEGDRIVGIITTRDIAREMAARFLSRKKVQA